MYTLRITISVNNRNRSDAIRAINLFTSITANAVIEADNVQGLKVIENLQDEGNFTEEENMDEISTDPAESDTSSAEPASDEAVGKSDATVDMGESDGQPDIKQEPDATEKKITLKKTEESKAADDTVKAEKDENSEIEKPSDTKDADKISPQDVKKLRQKTGSGMLDCKNALVETSGDFKKAEKVLKERGLASADKRAGRATHHGAVFTMMDDSKAAMIGLTCETDFVARNDVFRSTGEKMIKMLADSGSDEITDELKELVKEAIAVLKENMLLGEILYWNLKENQLAVNYSHNEGQIAVMIKMECNSRELAQSEEIKSLAFDIALHVAAYNPQYLDSKSIDPEYIKEQEEIFTTQAKNLGDKPEKILKGIVTGKIKKHLAQLCLIDQSFVKDEKKSVGTVIKDAAKKLGGKVNVVDYKYIAVGQKTSENE